MHYININKKRLVVVGNTNQQIATPIVMDYSTVVELQFQLINDQNQIMEWGNTDGLYFAGSVGIGKQSYELLFLSKEYEVSGNVVTFKLDTYTTNYLNYIKTKNTEINIEIGQECLEKKDVILRDFALACPRVYVSGLSPQEIASNNYYTKTEVDELISGGGGGGTQIQADWAQTDDTKVDFIKNKPVIPSALSELTNDEGFITGYTEVDPVFTATSGLFELKEEAFDGDYNNLTNKPVIPSALSELTNDAGFITGYTEVDPVFTATSGLFELKDEAFDGDYNNLTNKPVIPSALSELTNDEGFITGYTETDPIYTAASGRIVFLNNSGKIDKSLYSTNKQAIYIDPITYESSEITPFQLVYNSNYEVFYNTIEMTNNLLNIDVLDFPTTDLNNGESVTLENWLRFYNQDNAETISIASGITVIDEIPAVLSGTQTHVFVRRLFRDENGQYHEQISYSFSF